MTLKRFTILNRISQAHNFLENGAELTYLAVKKEVRPKT